MNIPGLPLDFANTLALLSLLSIIPLIILYLLRPKPVTIKIPSIMFLFASEEEKKRFSSIRRFIKDPLFLIQLLVLLLLGMAAAEPFTLSEAAEGGHTVIVLDASGSMQADQRFEKAISEAQRFLSEKNTIILAENIPVVVLRNTPKQKASEALAQLTPRAGEADLSRAILLATRYLSEKGRVIVISDFAHHIGDDPAITAGIARGSGYEVHLVPITDGSENVGIIDGWFADANYNTLIHNYDAESRTITLTVTSGNRELLRETRSIPPGASQSFTLQNLPEGKTTITLEAPDDFPLDNTAYIIIPPSLSRQVLHISEKNSPSQVALRLLEPTVHTTQVSPDYTGELEEYGIIIHTTPTTLSRFKDYVTSGGVLVVLAAPSLENSDLLPVTIQGVANRTTLNILSDNPLTENLDPNIEIRRHLVAVPKPGAVVLAEAGDGSPLLAYWNIGRGKVVYLGFAEPADDLYNPFTAWNSFHATPLYPLFWKNLIEWSTGSININDFNLRTGTLKQYPRPVKITTPTTSLTTDTVLFDETGFYTTPEGEVAVNLYSRDESDIKATANISIAETRTGYAPGISQTPKPLDRYFILAGIAFILLELYYLRWRREL